MNLTQLLSLLLLYRHNFQVIHWNLEGEQFDRYHELANKYYDKLADDLDSVAEMTGMFDDEHVVGYMEAYETISKSPEDYVQVTSNSHPDGEKAAEYFDTMLMDITKAIQKVLSEDKIQDPANVGVKAELEGMHFYYAKEWKYFNRRRNK